MDREFWVNVMVGLTMGAVMGAIGLLLSQSVRGAELPARTAATEPRVYDVHRGVVLPMPEVLIPFDDASDRTEEPYPAGVTQDKSGQHYGCVRTDEAFRVWTCVGVTSQYVYACQPDGLSGFLVCATHLVRREVVTGHKAQ